MTVFSAPDYPQFQDGPERYDNKAAVAVLTAPDWAAPQFLSYAAQPRPPIQAFYDFSAAGGDEEEDDEAAVATASEGGSVVATEDGDDCCEPSGADTASQVGGSELAGSGSAAAAGGEEDDEGEAGNSRQKRQARGSGTPKAPSSALPVIS